MVQGIETGEKNYKHKKKNDIKYLSRDGMQIRKTAESIIDENRPERKEKKSSNKEVTITPMRAFQLLVLGVFGPIILIGGIYMFMMDNAVIAIPIVLLGLVMVIALILNEIYK